jgi:hypothetical protein
MPGLNLAFLPGQRVDGGSTSITQELPPGGTPGQVLAKASAQDGDVEWISMPTPPNANQLIPTGGALNQVLTKSSALPFDTSWQNTPQPAPNQLVPPGGAGGQVLAKVNATNNNVSWQDVSGLPLAERMYEESEIEPIPEGPTLEEFNSLKAKIEELERKLVSLTSRRRSS